MDFKVNTKKYIDIILDEMHKYSLKPLKGEESKSFGDALMSTIYGLDTPREAKIQHTPKALFVANTLFRPLSEIMTTIEIIELIPIFISNFPFKRQGISRTRYLQYHIGNYFVETGKLKDSLIGYLGKIKNGYRKSQRKQEVDVVGKKIKKYITNSFGNIKNIRDEHLHKLRYTNKDIDRISLLELLCQNRNREEQQYVVLEGIYHTSYKEVRKSWASLIKSETSTIEKLLEYYFEHLIKLITSKGKVKYPKVIN